MSIFIPEKLRELVNGWLQKSNRQQEHGGVFFGTETQFKSFIPVPNFADTPGSNFNMGNARYYVDEFGKMIGLTPVAEMHTHPNGTVPSEGDLRYIKNSKYQFEIIISDMGNEFRWFCLDKHLKHVHLYFRDEELEKSFLLITQSFNLIDLGRIMVTPKYEIISETELGRAFLTLDADAMAVHTWLRNNPDTWRRTKTKIQQDTKLTPSRINKALKRLGIKDLTKG